MLVIKKSLSDGTTKYGRKYVLWNCQKHLTFWFEALKQNTVSHILSDGFLQIGQRRRATECLDLNCNFARAFFCRKKTLCAQVGK